MPNRSRLSALFLVALIVSTVVAFVPTSASATEGEMSVERAGHYYLNTVCAVNKSENRYYKKVFAGKADRFYYKDFTPKVAKKAKKLAPKQSTAQYRAGSRLLDPPAAWPAGIADRVERVADAYIDTSDQYDRVATKPRVKAFDAFVKMSSIGTRGARESKRVRAFLGLPSNGKGC